MPQIDDTAYAEGRAAFEGGRTIKEMVEAVTEAQLKDEPDEVTLSRVVGFADGFLAHLRATKS